MDPTPRDPVTPHDPAVPGAAYVPPPPEDVDLETRLGATDLTAADLQQLHWGPIFAGLLTAVGVFVLLTLPAVALGLQSAPGVEEIEDMGFAALLVTSVIALVAFFVGGFVSTWSAGISDTGRSVINGFLVWALWLVAVALLATFGIGAIAGAMGELFGQVGTPTPDVEADQLVEAVRSSSWQSFLALALTALAATLGGVVGAREELRGAWLRVASVRIRA